MNLGRRIIPPREAKLAPNEFELFCTMEEEESYSGEAFSSLDDAIERAKGLAVEGDVYIVYGLCPLKTVSVVTEQIVADF